ncbi:MAG: hypothetical protein NPIRA05_01100 [Nitrospirales bacterium]|nr:MAG: hypothetical protein NPIRA05_01100 [Nitrospirales bacterium]
MAYKTPGVYVKEISLFPPSVAEVATAIPAFIGYTEKAERKGQNLTNIPTRISSLLEYHELFGGEFAVTSINVVVDPANNYAVTSTTVTKRFYLYESLRLFFDNGGGACYIASVGNYGVSSVTSQVLQGGIDAVKKYDEPTILLFPDAVLLTDESQFATLQQRALSQCGDLQDRVAVFDVKENVTSRTFQESIDAFRNNIGINNLKYGAAYTPWLYTSYSKTVDFSIFRSNVRDGMNAVIDLETVTSDSDKNALVTMANTAITDKSTLSTRIGNLQTSSFPTLKDRYASLRNAVSGSDNAGAPAALTALIAYVMSVAVDVPDWQTALQGLNLKRDLNTYALDKLKTAVHDLIQLEKNTSVQAQTGRDNTAVNAEYGPGVFDDTGWLAEYDSDNDNAAVDEISGSSTDYAAGGLGVHNTALAIAGDVDRIFDGLNEFVADMVDAANTHGDLAQRSMYQGHSIISNIVEHIKKDFSKVPPSGPVVGVYAFVDRTRGVWKAPANVSLNAIRGPMEPIDFFDQEDLNVDVNGGKSVNAIRSFAGRGAAIIWGARTLAGNDNEWRYVPVRRFFNMVEESVKKSTAWAVFEPNSAPLWTKVKSMIDNYLIQKWREGALAGAVPEDAFFVKIGLGETMTAQDILEGRLIVEIGMAVVRPAEFIILKFSHKMQES